MEKVMNILPAENEEPVFSLEQTRVAAAYPTTEARAKYLKSMMGRRVYGRTTRTV